MSDQEQYQFHMLTTERWAEFEKLFGKSGAFGGCWCRWWFETNAEFEQMKGEVNRSVMRAHVEVGDEPGLLAYLDGEPVGWCAFGPRKSYPRLQRSRSLKAVDDQPVWSVVCFYISRKQRHKGLTTALLRAVIEEVRRRGGKIVEGYPNLPRPEANADAFIYMGMASAFEKAGFIEVARAGSRRVIMRYDLAP